jgi:hypothetical protein
VVHHNLIVVIVVVAVKGDCTILGFETQRARVGDVGCAKVGCDREWWREGWCFDLS